MLNIESYTGTRHRPENYVFFVILNAYCMLEVVQGHSRIYVA